jgi:hypothetical protein
MSETDQVIFVPPGVSITKDANGNSADSGYITKLVTGINSATSLWNELPTGGSMPGSDVPLFQATGKLLGGGVAKIVKYYRRPSANFMPRTQIDPLTFTIQRFTDPTTNTLAIRTAEGRWTKVSQNVAIERISYYIRKYSWSDARGSWSNSHKGKINSSAFAISGNAYAAKSLRFEGFRLRHYNWGAYNIYDMRFDFLHNPALWREEYDVTWNGSAWVVQIRDSYTAIVFPSLPS